MRARNRFHGGEGLSPTLRRMLAVIGALTVIAAGTSACSAPSAQSSPGATASTSASHGSVDCSAVQHDLRSIQSAQDKMVDDGTTTPQQIAGFVKQIDVATASLAEQASHALPAVSATWLSHTDAYLRQVEAGATSGKSVSQMLMAAGSFNSQGYQRAARSVAAYFTAQCPGVSARG